MVIITLFFMYCVPVASAQKNTSEIAQYMQIYGYNLPSNIQQKTHETFTPITFELFDLQITLRELLYDGCWVYTSAEVVPIEPSIILVYPGSAWLGDQVSGNYGENERADHRTFMEAANADGKRAVCVYVYPKDFDDLPVFFIDHLQRANDLSVLLSGAEIGKEEGTLPITWQIKAFEMNTLTGEPYLESFVEKTHQTTAQRLSPIEKKEYIPSDAQALPFSSMTLIKTGLTTYAYPQWKEEENQALPGFVLFDDNGNQYPSGAPPAGSTYTIENLPHALYIQMDNWATDGYAERIQLITNE